MATKKKESQDEETVLDPETGEKTEIEEETVTGEQTGTGEEPEETTGEEPADTGEAAVTLVYIGPNLPMGKLRTSMILRGTEKQVRGYVEDMLEQYPELPHLLVPPEKLSKAMDRVGRKGTVLHKYYQDVQAKSRAER